MQIRDEQLLAEFRSRSYCEWCGRGGKIEPHHHLRKGMGGGGRIDHPYNLVGLCRECHQAHHDGHQPLNCDILAIIAAREGVQQDDVMDLLWRIRRAEKGTGQGQGEAAPGDRGPDPEGIGDNRLHRPLPGEPPGDWSAGLETDQNGWGVL